MAQISFRILGNPASSGGYTPLISKGEPLEADKVEIPYPNYTTDGECYGIKLYQDVVSYALYTNPVKVTSFDGNRSAALNIYIYIPKGYIVSFEGKEVSPKHILDRLSEEFYTQFMTMKGGTGSAIWSYKTQTIEDFSESKTLFVDIINEYTLQEKKQKYIVMSGPANAYANVIVGSKNIIEQLMLDPHYEQLSSYDRLIVVENGESNIDTLSLTVPRPKTYKVYVNNSFIGQIKSDSQTITTDYQPSESYKIAENYSFTLQDVKEGKFANKVKIDDVNEIIYCHVTEKDKESEWSVIIRIDGKPADLAFKEQLYRKIYLESSGATKWIVSDRFKLVGAEINKKWNFRNLEQNGYDVHYNMDESKRTIFLSYTKKVEVSTTSVQLKPTQGSGTAVSKIPKKEYAIIRFSINDEDDEYLQTDFDGTKLIIESGNQKIIISLYLKLSNKKGIHTFEDNVEVEPFIADKILNNRMQVKSKKFTYKCRINHKEKVIQLIPEELSFFNRPKVEWWTKKLIIFLLCVISGGIGFYANSILLQNERESIEISEFNAQSKGYILKDEVYMDNGTLLGYILESNIYRTPNTVDEIIGVYNHKDKVLTVKNSKAEIAQNVTQPGTSVQPDAPSTGQPTVTNPPQSEQSKDIQKKLNNELKTWMKKIKEGTITFDEIEQCQQWANENSNASQVSIIKTCCDKIKKVKDFILSITLNTSYDTIKDKASALNSECYQEPYKAYLKHYRVILQKFIPTTNVTKDSIEELIYKVGLKNQEQGISSFNQINNL